MAAVCRRRTVELPGGRTMGGWGGGGDEEDGGTAEPAAAAAASGDRAQRAENDGRTENGEESSTRQQMHADGGDDEGGGAKTDHAQYCYAPPFHGRSTPEVWPGFRTLYASWDGGKKSVGTTVDTVFRRGP